MWGEPSLGCRRVAPEGLEKCDGRLDVRVPINDQIR